MSAKEPPLSKFLPFLSSSPNANDKPRTSGFTAQSHSIINSAQSFDNFRREARDKNITTSAGIKEMLHERYARKRSGERDLEVRGKLDDSDTSLNERRSMQPRQDSYRRKIRGDTDGILGYNYDTQCRGSKRSTRLNRIVSNLSSSLTRLADERQSRVIVRQEQHISRGLSQSLMDARGISTYMNLLSDDTSDGELEQGTHDHDSSKSGIDEQKEQGHLTSIQQASDSNSDDDRSNNGNFEYYPLPTKQEALQRRRSYRKDMRQSLPPKCERFIGIEDLHSTSIHDKQGAADAAADISKSMPPNSNQVDLVEILQIENDHCKVTRYHENPTDQSSIMYPGHRKSLSFNSEIIADLERCLLDEVSPDRNSDVIAPKSLRRSLPPNSHLVSTQDLLQTNEQQKIVRQHSKSLLPPKTSHISSRERLATKENFDSSFDTKKTYITDDLTQYTDGSELLVSWGDCGDSTYSE